MNQQTSDEKLRPRPASNRVTDPDCLFCKIAKGDIPSEKVYEDGETFAFLDIHPVNPGHTLVIPKAHARNIFDIDAQAFSELMKRAKAISKAVKEGLGADGVNLAMNNDAAAGQLVFHAHIHVIPRFSDDGFKHWPGKEYKEGEAKEVAEKIRSQF